MRHRILALVAFALAMFGCVQVASAVQFPSAVTGGYETPERACRVEFYRWVDPRWTVIQVDCLRWGDALHSSVMSVVFTLSQSGQGCPGAVPLPFDPRGALATSADKANGSVQGVLISDGSTWRPLPWLSKSAGIEHFLIRSYDSVAGTLDVLVGLDPSGLLNNLGTAQTWRRVETFASRAPYECAAPAPAVDPRRRNLICRVNPAAPSCGG